MLYILDSMNYDGLLFTRSKIKIKPRYLQFRYCEMLFQQTFLPEQ